MKKGDKVFYCDDSGRVYSAEIKNVIYDTGANSFAFHESVIGEKVFLTEKEAREHFEKENVTKEDD